MTNQKVRIESVIRAALQKVWLYWTTPEHITKWNFAQSDWHCPKATNDLRPGGTYFARMEAKDGSSRFDFEAAYDEVIDQERLAYTMSGGRKVITSFEQLEEGTKVTTQFDAETLNPIEMQKSGWQSILNNFKSYVEKSELCP